MMKIHNWDERMGSGPRSRSKQAHQSPDRGTLMYPVLYSDESVVPGARRSCLNQQRLITINHSQLEQNSFQLDSFKPFPESHQTDDKCGV